MGVFKKIFSLLAIASMSLSLCTVSAMDKKSYEEVCKENDELKELCSSLDEGLCQVLDVVKSNVENLKQGYQEKVNVLHEDILFLLNIISKSKDIEDKDGLEKLEKIKKQYLQDK